VKAFHVVVRPFEATASRYGSKQQQAKGFDSNNDAKSQFFMPRSSTAL
jgi:hypothetical protein